MKVAVKDWGLTKAGDEALARMLRGIRVGQAFSHLDEFVCVMAAAEIERLLAEVERLKGGH